MPAQVPGTRDALLRAALDAFTERGYGSTTMSDVRRAAGVSTGSLYHHFPTREHLAAAVWLDGLADFQEGFVRALRRARTAEDGIRAGVRFHLRWVREHRDLARLLLGEQDPAVVAAGADRLREQNARFFAAVRAWYDGHDELRDLPLDLLHALWLGPAQDVARGWVAGRGRTGLERAAEVLGDSAWRALERR